ncbi:hypothetical protein WM40_20550 [Robbsia andropogonis]|uniref:DNA gyrase inhibitor YacG n=1 Tax=Robbsia andropogonis TaxID=28092 RepID=A0A0F5JX88_9BURK|nr:DNA gyrase inhibitor YacG [Robbsia andropogonis]KKB61887.1 hypothetical protein WM40_20550 [Robbsia andropogonis]MCP1118291.1 DNA gyrase inhibitor YacG [Robbsia andropogonis]MCP1127931.1 DNA gyrase inhibitor YacG [Robbsia andropogonis]
MTTVKCPTCGASVEWKPENRFRPFCSERCKQIDLGAWAAEKYTISSDAQDPTQDGESGIDQGPPLEGSDRRRIN